MHRTIAVLIAIVAGLPAIAAEKGNQLGVLRPGEMLTITPDGVVTFHPLGDLPDNKNLMIWREPETGKLRLKNIPPTAEETTGLKALPTAPIATAKKRSTYPRRRYRRYHPHGGTLTPPTD